MNLDYMPDDKTTLWWKAKKWGLAHGYYGMLGGWIYRTGREKPVCQGWMGLYYLYRREIEAHHRRTRRKRNETT